MRQIWHNMEKGLLDLVWPVFKAAHDLLDEDDLVGDGLVPLDLQQHVMVVLQKNSQRRQRENSPDTRQHWEAKQAGCSPQTCQLSEPANQPPDKNFYTVALFAVTP